MRTWLIRAGLLAAMSIAAPGLPAAQGAGDLPPGVSSADRAAIRDVISGQLDAFKRDDAPGAYRFAGPMVRQMFPTADIFLDMVRRGYMPVYRPRSADFSELALREGELVQEVELVGPDGGAVLALYTMERDGSGAWVITGCSLVASVRVGA